MIAFEGVSKSYATLAGRKVVLDNVDARFATGHNFGILGANGAGKSTLIRLLAGAEHPDRGTIRRAARVSFPLGYGGTFHGALSRYLGADGTNGPSAGSPAVPSDLWPWRLPSSAIAGWTPHRGHRRPMARCDP